MELLLSLTALERLHFPASTGTPGRSVCSSDTYSCISPAKWCGVLPIVTKEGRVTDFE